MYESPRPLFRKMEDTDLGIIFRDRSCIIYIVDFWTISFFFERQRKTENDNYWGSPWWLYPQFRKMEDTDLEIIFRDCGLYFWTISFFFFGRQRKVRNVNYRGSSLYLHFRKMEDTNLRIIFQDRLYIVVCIFGRFLFFFWMIEKSWER